MMKLKSILLLAAYIAVSTVVDTMATEVRRIRLIVRMYKKGQELNTISDLMKALDQKKREEMNGISESWKTLKEAVDNKAV